MKEIFLECESEFVSLLKGSGSGVTVEGFGVWGYQLELLELPTDLALSPALGV